MNAEEVLLALETLARTLQVEVRYEKGDFIGGLCRIGDKQTILVQKGDPIYKKIAILSRALSSFDLDEIYVLPVLREIIAAELQEIESTR